MDPVRLIDDVVIPWDVGWKLGGIMAHTHQKENRLLLIYSLKIGLNIEIQPPPAK